MLVRDARDRQHWLELEEPTFSVKRMKHNDARVAGLYLIRKLVTAWTTEIAKQYGVVSQAAIPKTVERAELRRQEYRPWKQRLTRLAQYRLITKSPSGSLTDANFLDSPPASG